MYTNECARSKTLEGELIVTAPIEVPIGGEIPFNFFRKSKPIAFFNECRRCERKHVIDWRENDTRGKTRLKGLYTVWFQLLTAPSEANVISITDNEGQRDLTSLEFDSEGFGSLYIDENIGAISLVNAGTAPLILTPLATNTQVPVAKILITYCGK